MLIPRKHALKKLLVGALLTSQSHVAVSQGFNAGGDNSKNATAHPSSSKSQSSATTNATKSYQPVPSHKRFALGVNLGWEATYGNSVSFHWLPRKWLDLNSGLGFNRSGLKVGAGSGFIWSLTKSWGLRSGLALAYSSGSSGEVELDGYFTPEGSSKKEDITISKTYQLSSSILLGTFFGGYFAMTKSVQLFGEATYNIVLSGNEVTFDKDLQYSRDVEASNAFDADKNFEKRAIEKAETGGAGFNVGMRFLF